MESSMIQLQWNLLCRDANGLIDLQNENRRFRGSIRNNISGGMVDDMPPRRWIDS